MNRSSAEDPLLSSKHLGNDLGCLKKTSKWIIKVAILIIFVAWIACIILCSVGFVEDWFEQWVVDGDGNLFGMPGRYFLFFCAPIFIVAFLAIAHLIIFGGDEEEELQYKKKDSKNLRLRFWTFPVLVDGPFGVVSAAEMIGILVFSLYIIWAFSVYTIRNLNLVSPFDIPSKEKSALMVQYTASRFGAIGIMCLAVLFFPVARGSVLLQYIDIPFEHAIRYHTWLGHVTMSMFTLHGLFYVVAWSLQGRLLDQITGWKSRDFAVVPGVCCLLTGLTMWLTSISAVRRKCFELFYYTHQLYVVFVIFLVLHVGDFIFTIAAAGIFIFMLDRFLRFCQSRKKVDILSAKCFPCGTVELVLSKPANLQYNALGWVFVQIRDISLLQWHPFSVSSSPFDGKNHLAILIKVVGEWTGKLKDHILSTSEEEPELKQQLLHPQPKISVFVEGPYGHISSYHRMYENLILVAGGIGISPFLAILSDVLNHVKDRKPCLPKNILMVWAVKKSDELSLLQAVNMESICAVFSESLNLDIQTFVTRESEPALEVGKVEEPPQFFVLHQSKISGISVLVGTGNRIWSGMYVIVSTIGLVILFGLLDILYIKPFSVTCWWYKGLLLVGCMIASVLLFGGLVIGLWQLWERTSSDEVQMKDADEKIGIVQQNNPGMRIENAGLEKYVSSIHYGQRPDFGEIFGPISERWGRVDIGVFVCGPSTLQTSVARECRTHNLKRRNDQPIFHFNSHSFDL
ncbi:hypothetical protein ACH5RR_039013 [Cinchona calisaya]|uniref:FAD-binding FR-type domain-containing protein n=1 Tax=Cinchona calisaya TaxID=153742 RepID=A0ABD2Y129_9GENT